MLVCVLPIPPVTMISPSGRIETPGQNMSCAVLLTVALLTARREVEDRGLRVRRRVRPS